MDRFSTTGGITGETERVRCMADSHRDASHVVNAKLCPYREEKVAGKEALTSLTASIRIGLGLSVFSVSWA